MLNLQGDVIAIIDSNGAVAVEYQYDARGKEISHTTAGNSGSTLYNHNALKYRGYYYDNETGFHYVSSRYYAPEIGRFIHADSSVSGVGGDIRGYNLYSYCFNNPVNMSDPDGNWPKWLKEIGSRAKYLGKFVLGVVTAPLKSLKTDFGMGIGIGVKGSTTIGGIKTEVNASTSITDSLSYDKEKFDINNTTSTKVGFTVEGAIDVSYSNGKSHSFFDKGCGCSILHDSFVEQSKCSANVSIQETDMTIGLSVGLYLGLGAEVSVGIDLKNLYREWERVINEPYIRLCY